EERCRRERAEAALRLFADRADVMPKEGWASELAKANRDIPLWWFHAARVALNSPSTPTISRPGASSSRPTPRAEAERRAIEERCRRERAEAALRLFADRADVMPKEGWASEL
ncbi:hypothetical protein CTI14_54970, partial [Methylobacterium radiotolerans]